MGRLILSFLLIAFSASAFAEDFPASPAHGYRLFSEKGCFKCHSVLGQGGLVGHDLGRIRLKGSRLDVASNMLNNSRTMGYKMREMRILRPHFTGEQIESLVAFLYYANYFDEPGNANRGRELFKNRKCQQCHSPSLFPRNISPVYLATVLWNHGPRMRSEMLRQGIGWPTFEGAEMMDLVTYLKEVGQGRNTIVSGAPGDPNRGSEVFREKGCSGCHDGKNGPNLADPALGLQEGMTRIVSRLWNHAPRMFARLGRMRIRISDFSEREMADLVSYLYFLNYFDPPPNVDVGRRLFTEKQCAACHSLGGGFRGTGPDLAASQKGPMEMVAAMWNHTPFMQSIMEEKKISWPYFEKGELNHLLDYVRSLRQSPVSK